MKPSYKEDKATQAACRLIQRHGGGMSYMKLIKLLYLADRESLARHGRPITFDKYASLPRGPILSRTLDLINEGPPQFGESYWYRFITPPENFNVRVQASCPDDELSDAELQILDDVYERFGGMDKWDLVHWMHDNLPEWKDPEGSSIPIHYKDILTALNRTEQEIAALDAEFESLGFAERVFKAQRVAC